MEIFFLKINYNCQIVSGPRVGGSNMCLSGILVNLIEKLLKKRPTQEGH